MKKIEYRCNKCLIIEERFLPNFQEPQNTAACHKCGGLAIRLPLSKWKDKIFEDFAKKQ
jgi:hypothetical protein